MGFLTGLLSRSHQARHSEPPQTVHDESNRDGTRKELLRMAVQDTLRKHGIPPDWIGLEIAASATTKRERGLHLRLVINHWQPKFLEYTVALQRSIKARLLRLDPLAGAWMTGISWKVEIGDESPCPELPSPAYWERFVPQAALAHGEAAPAPRAALEQLLAAGDRGRSRDAEFAQTQPMQRL
jgi:hypothetical protein